MKILHGTYFAEDNGDIFVVCGDKTIKLTDARKLVSIAITTPPTKTSYIAGQTFVATGMVVTATYDDGSTAAVTGCTYSPSGALATTDTKIVVSYKGKTAEQAITVAAKAVSSIAITTAPTKVTYSVGETFDPAGMVVTATYNDETIATVSGYSYAPTTALTAEDTTVTVTYETKTATQAITVS